MEKTIAVSDEVIISKIYFIRGKKVMLDRDLAELYGVPTKRLNEQVKRNIHRFPADFMFQLTDEEFENLKSQIATSSWGGRRVAPYTFTEHGVLMLSSVLNSETAIEVNIQIIRIFIRMRELLLTHKDILVKLEQIEKTLLGQDHRMNKHEENIQAIFGVLKELVNPTVEPRPRIGFRRTDEMD